MGATVVDQKYLGEGKQRNVTERLARHDWILALDADERLDEEMVATIRKLDLRNPAVGYAFNRKSYVGRRWIRGPGFYPDFITRLYNRTQAAYEPKFGHAGVQAPQVQRVPGHIVHYTYDSLSDWVAKINQVSSLDAQGMYQAGRRRSSSKPGYQCLRCGFSSTVPPGRIFRGEDGWTIVMTSIFRSFLGTGS
ncbi:MAG: glycosyltransferase family 2 protein [Gammaproteobacteria bacterium]